MPKPTSMSDNYLPESKERRASQGHFSSDFAQSSSVSAPYSTQRKRPRTSESSSLVTSKSRNDPNLDSGEEGRSVPFVYAGSSSMRQIVDSVVSANVALSSPPASRSCSPHDEVKARRRFRQSSQSRPTTRTNSPNPGTRPSTPIPSGWISASSRHSLRRFDVRPWGPRHLEYDYNQARKEFQAAAYYALGQYGYEPPKGIAKYKAPAPQDLPSMDDLRKVPEFAKACRKLDAADRALEEALSRGEIWENSAIPDAYLRLSLEDAIPEDLCVRRLDNAGIQERSRSSVTLEEAAGRLSSSFLAHSSAAPTSVPSSASVSDKATESVAGDEAQSSRTASVLSKLALSNRQIPAASSGFTSDEVMEIDGTRRRTIGGERGEPFGAQRGSDNTSINTSSTPSGRKRLLSEIEEKGAIVIGDDRSKEHEGMGQVEKRTAAPEPNLATPEKQEQRSLGRTDSESTTASGSGSGSIETFSRGSPPTSVSSEVLKDTPARMRGSRTGRARGRRRGVGRGK